MDPVNVSTVIDRPRELVFEYLADIANHAEFTDHFLVNWHLTREHSIGRGAGARFQVKIPGNRFNWADVTFSEVEPPYRIVEVGRAGKANRVRTLGLYELSLEPGGATKVEYTVETHSPVRADKLLESLGARGWVRRQNAKAMRRLRTILEDGEGRGTRATIAGR